MFVLERSHASNVPDLSPFVIACVNIPEHLKMILQTIRNVWRPVNVHSWTWLTTVRNVGRNHVHGFVHVSKLKDLLYVMSTLVAFKLHFKIYIRNSTGKNCGNGHLRYRDGHGGTIHIKTPPGERNFKMK